MYRTFISIVNFGQLHWVFSTPTRFSSNFDVKAPNWTYSPFYNSNYFKSNRSASSFENSSANQTFCKLSKLYQTLKLFARVLL